MRLDTEKLGVLYADLGTTAAENVVCRAIEALAQRLSTIEYCFYNGDRDGLVKSTKSVVGIADQVGMNALSRVASNVVDCHNSGDDPAFAATLSRLIRLGDRSLSAVWEMQDVNV